MSALRLCTALALAAALSGCSTLRAGSQRTGATEPTSGSTAPSASPSAEPPPESPPQDTSNPEESNGESTQTEPNPVTLAPCLPIDNTIPKIKTKPRPVRKKPPPPPPAPQVPETPPDGIIDAQVAKMPVSVMSILGKKVQSPKGDDLGRVVDVLADSGGRVRVAIIDFGGFLGVGDRRIAVDWPLLRFNPDKRDPSLLLSLSRDKLKTAPEYKADSRPQTLMVPAPAGMPAAPATEPAAAPAPTAPAPTSPAPNQPAPSAPAPGAPSPTSPAPTPTAPTAPGSAPGAASAAGPSAAGASPTNQHKK